MDGDSSQDDVTNRKPRTKSHVTIDLSERDRKPEADPLLEKSFLEVPKVNGHTATHNGGESQDSSTAGGGGGQAYTGGEEFNPPDGGYGWLVCFASFWVNGTVFGMLNTFGVLLPKISEMGAGEESVTTKVSLIASITLFMTFFMSMISSIAADQLGIRKVAAFGGLLSFAGVLASSFVQKIEVFYLTYGVMFGFGSSFIYSGSLVILGHYFKRRMALVNGIVTTGSAIFTIALPYMLKYTLRTWGLSVTLQIESGLVATTVICGIIFKPLIPKPTNQSQSTTEAEEAKRRARSFLSTESIQQAYEDATGRFSSCFSFIKRYLNMDIWKNRGYVIWAVGITFSLFGYFIPLVHINNYVKKEFPDKDGEILIMAIGGVSGVGRLVSGKLGDMKCVNRVLFQQIAFAIYGIATLVIPFINIFEVLIALCLILGVMDGCFVCLLGPIAFDIVGARNASQAMGFLLAMISIPLMMGPMIGGWIFDATGSYDNAFYFAGVPPLVGAAIMFFIPKITSRTDEGGTQAEAFASISHWSLYDPNASSSKSRGQSMLGLGLTPAKTTTDDSNRLLINGSHPNDNHMDDHETITCNGDMKQLNNDDNVT